MKKKIISVTFILSCMIGLSAIAQNPESRQAAPIETTVEAPASHPDGKCPDSNGCRNKRMPHNDPFDGIELTSDQKAKIEALRTNCKNEKAQCCKNDSTASNRCRNNESCCKPEKNDIDKAAQKQQRLNDIKKILTTDQYVKFLENIVTSQPERPNPRHHGHR